VGSWLSEIELTAYLPGNRAIKARKLPVRLEIEPDIQATPPQVHFGVKKQGEKWVEAINIRSLTGVRFKVTMTRSEGSISVMEKKSPENQNSICTYLLSQEISKIGQHSGQVVFSIEANDGKKSEIIVPVAYHGTPAKEPSR
jgi:hypothetical protein